MKISEFGLLFVAGVGAGIMNAVAGGGTFLSFPALVFIGLPSILANATSAIGVVPGSVASVVAYRKLMVSQKRTVFILGALSAAGGTIGALALLSTPNQVFDRIVPWLLLVATVLFAFGKPIRGWIAARRVRDFEQAETDWRGTESDTARKSELSERPHRLGRSGTLQFLISIYGGFYGAGAGILELAVLDTMGFANIHVANGLKMILSTAFNLPAAIVFIVAGLVDWKCALILAVSTIIGGYGGAHYAQKLHEKYVRGFVIVVGVVMTVYFFWR
jgi:uncharacterized protein